MKIGLPSSHQVASVHSGTCLQQLVHELAVTLQTGPVQGRAVQLGVETGDEAEGAQPPPQGPAPDPIPSTRFLEQMCLLPDHAERGPLSRLGR